MRGKFVTRGNASSPPSPPPSFEVLETSNKLLITAESEQGYPRLCHFGLQERFEYPWIGIPLLAHQNSPFGILCLDGVDEIGGDGSEGSSALQYHPSQHLL